MIGAFVIETLPDDRYVLLSKYRPQPVNIFDFLKSPLAQFFELLFYSLLWGAS